MIFSKKKEDTLEGLHEDMKEGNQRQFVSTDQDDLGTVKSDCRSNYMSFLIFGPWTVHPRDLVQ